MTEPDVGVRVFECETIDWWWCGGIDGEDAWGTNEVGAMAASGFAFVGGLSSDAEASSGKKVLKTPLCCQAWMKNSCWVGSLMALTRRRPSGCLRYPSTTGPKLGMRLRAAPHAAALSRRVCKALL